MAINVDQDARLRPFDGSVADYALLVAIGNAVFPNNLETVEQVQHWDARRPALYSGAVVC